MLETIERLESEVRSYCRSFPTVFRRAKGSHLWDISGRRYIDFFAGAGSLNYGHNRAELSQVLVEYIQNDGIAHGLDMATEAKCRFLEAFEKRVLLPRGLDFRVMFPGPTGTNAVEAALKLARKVTGRTKIVAFTHAFHGMTLGALAATGNAKKRAGAGLPLEHTSRMPFAGYFGDGMDTLDHIEELLRDGSSGIDDPAAFIVETVQGEGGVNVASWTWLRGLEALAHRFGALLIVDDIQVGCGRTGPFFSFEPAGIRPDIVCLSKSLSGYGLPLAVTLLRPDLDVWDPGEHNGTFRGNNHAFVTARAALDIFWRSDSLPREVAAKAELVCARLGEIADELGGEVRGRGLIQGLVVPEPGLASEISAEAFANGLLVETSGADDEVVKLLPPLTIEPDVLEEGLDILESAARTVRERSGRRRIDGIVLDASGRIDA